MRLRGVVLALALALAGCATPAAPVLAPTLPTGGPEAPPPPPPEPPPATLTALSPSRLPGWGDEDHLAALKAYAVGCGRAQDQVARAVCAAGRNLVARGPTPSQARAFFESRFEAVPAETADGTPGLLTSYFAPEYPARRTPGGEFDAPVLARPADLVRQGDRTLRRLADGRTEPYPDRAAIEAAPPAPTLAWMKAEDLFFLQIQGSGYLTFEDGGRARAAYVADNGQKFTGVARPMAEQGLLPPNGTSGEAIAAWLAAHRGPEARAVMALNPRYIFFRLDPDDGGDPAGAAGVPLPARRAIAVDPAHWRYGDLVWLSAQAGDLPGARASYQGLVTALDTGSAIRGPVRADLYMGRGAQAGVEAGSVRHPLRMWRLIPKS